MIGGEQSQRHPKRWAELESTTVPEERLRILQTLLAEAPENVELRYQYAYELLRSCRDDQQALNLFRQVLALDPKHAKAYLGLGVIYHRRGDIDTAEAMYAAAAEADPRLVRAWLNLGALATARRDYENACRAYSWAVKLRPKEPAARRGLAHALHKLGQWVKAREEWNEALSLNPEDPVALRGLARTLGMLQDPGVIAAYERALAANPDSISLRVDYANILQDLGKVDSAENVLSAGVQAFPRSARLWEALAELFARQGQTEKSISVLREGFVQTAGDHQLRMQLAKMLCRNERLAEAARELRPLIMANPRDGERRRLIAVIYACEGWYEQAVEAATAALRVQPTVSWPRVLLMDVPNRPTHPMSVLLDERPDVPPIHRAYALAVRGFLQLALGESKSAASLLGQAVQIAPEAAVPRVGRALVYLTSDHLESAYAELRTATILEPQNPHIQHLFGEVAFHTGRFKEATEAFNIALQDESVAAALRAFTFFCRARAYRKRGLRREAIDSYLQAERLAPEYAASFFGCGVALQEAGKVEEALQHYQRCVALNAQHARALLGMATCLATLGRAPEAMETYRQAIAADPTYALPHYNLAVLLERTGDPLEVAALLRGYLRREPNGPQAEDAQRRLRLAELRASGVLSSPELPSSEQEEPPFLDLSENDAFIDFDSQ
ncbi:MAG: tetratricopeptide repeat protein [Candidatus Zipacnadales bacterium]